VPREARAKDFSVEHSLLLIKKWCVSASIHVNAVNAARSPARVTVIFAPLKVVSSGERDLR